MDNSIDKSKIRDQNKLLQKVGVDKKKNQVGCLKLIIKGILVLLTVFLLIIDWKGI